MNRPARVHSAAIIEGPIELFPNVEVGAFAYLAGPLTIGPGVRIFPHATIGCEGEHRSKGPAGVIRIGASSVIREGAAVQRGTGERETRIGEHCYVMHGAHVSHDTVLEDDVTLSPNVVLGGHSTVQRGATVGIGAMCHQFTTIGAYAMVGMGAVVTRDVPPFCLVVGNPARFVRLNTHAMSRLGLTDEDIRVEGGALRSEHPIVVEALRRFDAATRRDRMVLP